MTSELETKIPNYIFHKKEKANCPNAVLSMAMERPTMEYVLLTLQENIGTFPKVKKGTNSHIFFTTSWVPSSAETSTHNDTITGFK